MQNQKYDVNDSLRLIYKYAQFHIKSADLQNKQKFLLSKMNQLIAKSCSEIGHVNKPLEARLQK